jgi:FlaA1/EpsC-like NDP-sugar epimerase
MSEMGILSVLRGVALRLSGLSRAVKKTLLVSTDVAVLSVALLGALLLKNGSLPSDSSGLWVSVAVAVAAGVLSFALLGLYRSMVRFLSSRDTLALVAGVALSSLVAMPISIGPDSVEILWEVAVIYAALAIIGIGGSRLVARHLLHQLSSNGASPIIIYGAGYSGRQVLMALQGNPSNRVVAFIDDSPALHGTRIAGLRVYAVSKLPDLIRPLTGVSVLLAIPSASGERRQEILRDLSAVGVHVRSLPDFAAIMSGEARIDEIRELNTDDLLGRAPVAPHPDLFSACVEGKGVMVTGAGGSIGSELCRQLIKSKPRCLVLVESSEFALYDIERELRAFIESRQSPTTLIALLGDAGDGAFIERILRSYGIQTVYHAAAYKHVPIVETNVLRGLTNNVFTTRHAAEAAARSGVETFVLVSTDKAVNPTNVMGASKRAAEMILQALQERHPSTKFAMVRFGNVLASSGSVVPLFQEQIKQGGPVTVTHPDVVRYFMTIREAAQLVVQASAMAEGGDVFVLDMGQPVKIVDLARRIVTLMGLSVRDESNPSGDIEIRFTGLRPAEKLFEELLIGTNVTGTRHPRILRAVEHMLPWDSLSTKLDSLSACVASSDVQAAIDQLSEIVVEFRPDPHIHDLLWKAARTSKEFDSKVASIASRRTSI